MADEFDGSNEPEDMKLDAELLKILETYADLDEQSRTLSGKRAELRAKADKFGVSSHALQDGVYKLKRQTKAERLADEKAARRLVRIAEGRQADLWPEETTKNEKRVARKKDRAAKAAAKAGAETPEAQERRLAADSNPRSDPKRGGAGRKAKTVKDAAAASDAALAESIAAQEQKDGSTVLDSHIDAMKEPLSQSEQAAAARSKAGLE